jgi:O-antigen/teichoic acid export membrane protein
MGWNIAGIQRRPRAADISSNQLALLTIIIGRAAQFLLALIMLRVATTLLSPEEMGKVSLTLTTIAFFALFLINPVGMFINRRLHAWQSSGVGITYLRLYTRYLCIVALIAATSLPLIHISGWINFGIPVYWLLLLVCGSLIFNTINQTAIPSLNLLGDSTSFVVLTVASLALSFICALVWVKVAGPTAESWLAGLLLGQVFVGILGTRILFVKLQPTRTSSFRPHVDQKHLRVLFAFAWPLAIAAGLGWVQAQSYRFILENQMGLDQLGLFVAGYSISAGIIAGFESVLTTYFQPRLYRDANDPVERAEAWHRYAAAVIPSLVLTVALLISLAPELTRLLLGTNFQSSSNFVVWGACAEAMRVLVSVYALIAHVHMRTGQLILPNLVGGIFSVLLCSLLIPHMGANGAGAGLAGSSFAIAALMQFMLVRKLERKPSVLPIVAAFGTGIGLCILSWGLRHELATDSWLGLAVNVISIGTIFLSAQYFFLRKHLVDKPVFQRTN